MRGWIFETICITITVVWFVAIVANIFDRTYTPPPALHGLMTAIVGAYAGDKVFRKLEKTNNKENRQ